jgi:hypothetical protein
MQQFPVQDNFLVLAASIGFPLSQSYHIFNEGLKECSAKQTIRKGVCWSCFVSSVQPAGHDHRAKLSIR